LFRSRSRAIAEHAQQALASKVLATMRRDLDLDVEPDGLVLRPPDRSQLKEIFRRFEFRALLGRIETLDEALPAAERPKVEPEAVTWSEGALRRATGRVGVAWDGERAAIADGDVVVSRASCDELHAALRDAATR